MDHHDLASIPLFFFPAYAFFKIMHFFTRSYLNKHFNGYA
uniref:Uncharacterized protein n=1 Tax=Arundo donax TaxID=35708 RepID=A0A0A9UAH1_ARUDO